MKTYSSNITNISNLLSLSRIFLLVPFYFLYVEYKEIESPTLYFLMLSLALFIGLTDYLDGYYARKRNETSELGKILDPVADKVAILFFAILLYFFESFPLWIVYVLVFRDVLIVIGAFLLMGKMNEVPSSEWPGKITSFVLSLLFISYLAGFDTFKVPLEMISILMVAYSFLDYILKFIRLKSK